MPNQHSIARLVATVSAVALVALSTGCSKPADQGGASTAPAPSAERTTLPLSTQQALRPAVAPSPQPITIILICI